jgi:hypothetical protein
MGDGSPPSTYVVRESRWRLLLQAAFALVFAGVALTTIEPIVVRVLFTAVAAVIVLEATWFHSVVAALEPDGALEFRNLLGRRRRTNAADARSIRCLTANEGGPQLVVRFEGGLVTQRWTPRSAELGRRVRRLNPGVRFLGDWPDD